MNLTGFLDLGEQIERILSECYRKLGGRCAEGPLRGQLSLIADEELNHANALAAAKSYARKMPDLFGQPILTAEDVRTGLESAKKLAGDIEESKDVGWGLRQLAEVERQFEKIHIGASVEIKDPSLKSLFDKLSGEEQHHHVEVLDEILRFFP